MTAARVAVERRRRAVEAAEARLLHAQEERATADGRLGQAEEELSIVLEIRAAAPPVESADVTQARVRLDDATRAAEAAAARLARLEADPSVATAIEAVVRAVAGPGPAEAGQVQPFATGDTRSGRDPAMPASSAGVAEASGEKGPVYASLDAFVEGYVLPQWRHKLGGYRKIHRLLVDDGWAVSSGQRQTDRAAVAGRGVERHGVETAPTAKGSAKPVTVPAINMARPALRPGHIWSYDFVSLRTEDGRPLRLLNVVDEYTRMAVGFDVARSIGARRVRQVIERLLAERRSPGRLERDGGPELIRSGLMIERQGVHLL